MIAKQALALPNLTVQFRCRLPLKTELVGMSSHLMPPHPHPHPYPLRVRVGVRNMVENMDRVMVRVPQG